MNRSSACRAAAVISIVVLGCNDLFDLKEARTLPVSSSGGSGAGGSGETERGGNTAGGMSGAGGDPGEFTAGADGGAPNEARGGTGADNSGAGGAIFAEGGTNGPPGADGGHSARANGGTESGGAPNAGSPPAGASSRSGGSAGVGGDAPGGNPGVEGTPCGKEGLSCAGGLKCGDGTKSCCASLRVPGGSFNSGSEAVPTSTTVADFCLDKYEVSVGRFRSFLAAYDAWRKAEHPTAGEGLHPLLGAPSGWMPSFDATLPRSAVQFANEQHLTRDAAATWSDTPGDDAAESRPINDLSWYEAFAFCIWDGGRLPTVAEWEYAAAHGAERRVYPWGDTITDDDAAYACLGDRKGGTCSAADILPVGLRPLGDGYWGQSDLGGNVAEWVLDYVGTVPSVCDNCAQLTESSSPDRVHKGGGWDSDADGLRVQSGPSSEPRSRFQWLGVRCARTPL